MQLAHLRYTAGKTPTTRVAELTHLLPACMRPVIFAPNFASCTYAAFRLLSIEALA